MNSPNDFAVKTDVVIIGAGPTGLALACQLTHPFSVLLRPDNYIGFLSAETTLSELTVYLEKFVGKQTLDENAKLIYSHEHNLYP